MFSNNEFEFLEKLHEPGYLLDTSHEGIAIFDENHRLVECNRRFASMLGYTVEELLGKPSWCIDADMTEAQVRRVFQDLSKVDRLFESRHRRKDGSVYDVEFSARGTTISGRQFIITVSRDVTERKQERNALLRTQFAMDNTRDTCIWVAEDGCIAYANYAACASLGYPREQLLRMKIFDIDPDFPADRFEAHKQELFVKRSMIFEGRHIAKDGRIFPVEVSTSYFGDKGRFLACSFARDISERKLAEKALRESHDLLEQRVSQRTVQLEELNRLQALLVELATAYINLPLENIDDAINASLGKMGAFVEADRAYVFDYDFHRQVCINTHEWCAPEIPPQIANLQAVPLSSVPDWVAAHQRGDTLHIQAVSALNHDCDLRQLLESQEIKSLIAVPMMKGPECLGFVGFDAVARQRRYSEQQKQLLTVFAQILINIRLRRQAEDAARRQHLFQEIVAGMAADFVGITGENVQEKITVTLKRFSTFLEIDRSSILIFSPENETWSVISQWCHREVEPIQERLRKCPDIDWSWIGRRIRRGGPPVHFPDVNALTDEERDEKACLLKLGVKSALFLPLYTSQRLYGMIGFDTVNQPMRWPEDQINGLRVVAQILANAFSSIDARQALVEAKATLEQRVEARTRELQTQVTAKETALAQLAAAQSSLLEASRVAGRSEVATEVLHNVGNVLNNVNVSCTLLMDQLRQSRVGNVARVAGLMAEAGDDLARFLAQDQGGRQIPAYLQSLAAALRQEHRTLFTEAETLHDRIEHIKEIVAMQQSYGRVFGVKEKIAPEQLMEDALKLNAGALARHGITVKRRYAPMPPISVDKHAVLQILLNLVNNAKYACTEGGKAEKTIRVSVSGDTADRVRMQVADNGMGIAPEDMTRIFQHGFTTRRDGHGFGLHSGALAARDLGGSLSAHSDGPGRGAIFTLELPCQ